MCDSIIFYSTKDISFIDARRTLFGKMHDFDDGDDNFTVFKYERFCRLLIILINNIYSIILKTYS